MFDGSRQTTSHLIKLHPARPVTPFLQTQTSILHCRTVAGDEDEQKEEIGFLYGVNGLVRSPSFPSGYQTEWMSYVCIYSLFCSNYKATNKYNNNIVIPFFAVLPAGTVVMAWSTAVAATDAVPLSHNRHLHRPYPHL